VVVIAVVLINVVGSGDNLKVAAVLGPVSGIALYVLV